MDFGGKRVLIVEDEPIIAMSVEDVLVDLGCVVVGPAFSASEGLDRARTEALDAAILDINLGAEASFAIAATLRQRGVRFCFATGYGNAGVPEDFNGVPVLAKPHTGGALAEMLGLLLAPQHNMDASPPD